jgi:hypothetical protein
MNQTRTLEEIKAAIDNQIQAEKTYGAEGEILQTIENVLSDLYYIIQGGFIVNGVRM